MYAHNFGWICSWIDRIRFFVLKNHMDMDAEIGASISVCRPSGTSNRFSYNPGTSVPGYRLYRHFATAMKRNLLFIRYSATIWRLVVVFGWRNLTYRLPGN